MVKSHGVVLCEGVPGVKDVKVDPNPEGGIIEYTIRVQIGRVRTDLDVENYEYTFACHLDAEYCRLVKKTDAYAHFHAAVAGPKQQPLF